MTRFRGFGRAALAMGLAGVLLAGCGDGEDRPGQVTSEDGGSGTGTGSASASGTGSGSHSGTGMHSGGDGAAFSKADADVAVDVVATDFRFEGIPATIAGTKVFFAVKNSGKAEHEFDVKGEGEIEPFEPGESETLALALEPGEYKVICLVKEGDQTHEQMGMSATFTVTGKS